MDKQKLIEILKDAGCRECDAVYGNEYDQHINEVADKILKGNESYKWTNSDIDAAYIMGIMSTASFEDLDRELNRLKRINLKPHVIVSDVRGKNVK